MYILWFPVLCSYGISLCVNVCVSASIFVSCGLLFGFFNLFDCFVLSWFDFCSYFVIIL